ncbi:choline-sulfatase [Polytolypa hystricis UAMH7299]|uniref:Choline-sulfatase n=1 Tax=Polytolypa hystricis (strain UAMH7299) TaxID=1447883 RepID=A0A2B7YQ78_POLH7|nr:choline-sulfatase [Polytolypa hystricis UAMH7299]
MATKKPNILYIMADQMAAPLLSMHDKSSAIKTPTLDRLARDGIVFESAYCNSPLCAPSRFTMVTGQLPSRIGGFDNASDLSADIPTYAHYLRKEGYHTALSGKMHFAGPDQLHGYEQRLTSDIYPGDYGWTVNWDEPEIRPDWYHDMSSVLQAGPCVRSNQLDYDDEVIYKAKQYLFDHVRHRTDQPFCLTVSMTHPHDPYAMTREYWDLYDDADIPLPRTPAIPQDKLDPHSQRVLKCIDAWGKSIPEERIIAARRAYFAACSYVDAQIAALLKTLEDCGVADDTIVVFSGDHGDMLGEKGLWYKMVWYEMAARVPLIVYAPGRYAAKRVSENVSTMDLMPTFLAMSGGKLDLGLPIDGVSLMPYIEDTEGEKTDTVVGEYMAEGTLAPVVMIRRGPWKFVYSPLDPPMLFNVKDDPLESVNLAAALHIPDIGKIDKEANGIHTAAATLPKPALPPPTQSSQQTTLFPTTTTTARIAPTPPDTPSPNKSPIISSQTLGSKTTPESVLRSFLEEVHTRWSFPALTALVQNSQRRRRLVYAALTQGHITQWDYSPPVDGGKLYIRNHGKGALGDVETLSRWPRASMWSGEDKLARERRLAAQGSAAVA